jgi:ATP-dependent protease ClpP protease subunit
VKQPRPLRPPSAGAADWYRITNLADSAEVVIYDEIGWWGTSAADFMNELKQITADTITLRLNSPGGDVFDGVAIMNALRSHPATVTTQVDGLAASIASVIALAGDRIVMQPGATMMIHDASGMCYGQAPDMRELADMLDRHSDNIASLYAERAGGTVAEWRERMRGEAWFNADEAVAAGLADEVGQRRATNDEPATNSWDLARFRYAGREHAPAPVAVMAAASQTPPVEPAAGPTPPPEGALMALDEGLRERLGLDADADEAAILTAVDELVDKATEPPAPAPEPVVEPVAARLPEGTVIVDKATLDELRQQASEGVAARAQQRTEARDRAISDAISKGKVLPARRQHWQDSWDADPDGTRAMLDSLAEGLIPLADLGEPGGEPTDNGFDAEVDRLFSTPGRA